MRIWLVLLVWLAAVRLCGCSVCYVGLNCLFFVVILFCGLAVLIVVVVVCLGVD